MEMRCAKGEDVRQFLASLCYRREELVTAGVKVTEKEYERTILCGIPSELATFASQLLSSALIIGPATSIDPDALHNQICEEADCLKSRRACGQPDQGAKRETTEAFEATESDGRRQRRGKCQKCGEEGHWARVLHPKERGECDCASHIGIVGGNSAAQHPACGGSPHLPCHRYRRRVLVGRRS